MKAVETDQFVSGIVNEIRLVHQAIALRRVLGTSAGDFRWLESEPGVLAFTRGDGFACVVNCSSQPVCMPVDGHVLHASDDEVGEKLPPNSAAWLLVESPDDVDHGAGTTALLAQPPSP